MIVLPPLGVRGTGLWHALLDVADRVAAAWTLVGGQMVLLHALEHDRPVPRISEDLDLVVDTRVRPRALPILLGTLESLEFADTGISADGVAHRFARQGVVIDVLAPEGVGTRADLRTIGAAVTVAVSGGSFALARSQLVDLQVDGRVGRVPRPDLAGALVIKAMAAQKDRKRGPERHLRDLAFLLSLVQDPFNMREELGRRNCRRIGGASALQDPLHEAWFSLPQPADRRDAQAALALIGREPA
ncbi:MAG: hypothetical protein QOK40_2529 [Miltoncostaeaceae bacterium]|nr:hypothetical protein [Miltoncostaeaceae bacterium]